MIAFIYAVSIVLCRSTISRQIKQMCEFGNAKILDLLSHVPWIVNSATYHWLLRYIEAVCLVQQIRLIKIEV